MTLNDINCKVNLPSYFSEHQLVGYQFTKLPRFGWFGFNSTRSEILSFSDLLIRQSKGDMDEAGKLLKHIILARKDLHEIPIPYSETLLNKALRSLHEHRFWQLVHKASMVDLSEGGLIRVDKKLVPAEKWMNDNGFTSLIDDGAGTISEKLVSQIGAASKITLEHPTLLMPSWFTPKHIASLELLDPATCTLGEHMYTLGEKGWYGTLDGSVLPSIEYLKELRGCTWDKKADYWTTEPLDVHPHVPVNQLLQIWQEAKATKFITSPLDRIDLTKDAEFLKGSLPKLKYPQIKELEDKLKTPLVADWKKLSYNEVTIRGIRYYQQNNQYFMEMMNGRVDDLADFTITIERIVQTTAETYSFIGVLAHDNDYIPFEWRYEAFQTPGALMLNVRKLFFENRLGIPIVNMQYQRALVEVIQSLNRHVLVEKEDS